MSFWGVFSAVKQSGESKTTGGLVLHKSAKLGMLGVSFH